MKSKPWKNVVLLSLSFFPGVALCAESPVRAANPSQPCIGQLAAESIPAIQSSHAAFHKVAEWRRVKGEAERDGILRSGVTADKLTPTDFSAGE